MATIRDLVVNRTVFSVEPDITVAQAVRYLCENRIGAVAVCERGQLVGVFSERDLMQRVVDKGLEPSAVLVRDVMTRDVFHVSIDDSHHTARAIMLNKNFRHLVVLDEAKHLRGFVSMRELLDIDIAESQELMR